MQYNVKITPGKFELENLCADLEICLTKGKKSDLLML